MCSIGLAHELGGQIGVEAFGPALAALAAVLDSAEGGLRCGEAEAVDRHHPGFDFFREDRAIGRQPAEHERRQGVGQCIGRRNRLVDIVESRSEEHTSELQSLMRISYAVFCLKKTTMTISLT